MSKETAMNKYEARALLASKQVETFTNHRLLCLYNQLALRNVLITLTSNQVETKILWKESKDQQVETTDHHVL